MRFAKKRIGAPRIPLSPNCGVSLYPHFFDPAALGQSLKEVATDYIRSDETEILSRWFHSPKDVDFFVWMDHNRNILKQQLTFYGQVVEWNIIEGVRTGLIVEDESRAPVKAAELIHFDVVVQPKPIEQALHLLRNMTALGDSEREAFIYNFTKSPTSKTIDPQDFVRRYGHFLKARPSATQQPPKFSKLRRFLSWIRHLFS